MIKIELVIEELTKEGINGLKATLHGEEEELIKFTEKLLPLLEKKLPQPEEKQNKQESEQTTPPTVSVEKEADIKEVKIEKPKFVVCLDRGKVLLRMILKSGKSYARFVAICPEVKDEIENYIQTKEEAINTLDEFEKVVRYLREKYGYYDYLLKRKGGKVCH